MPLIEKYEIVIIGGGQAGLSLSYFLTQAGREHIILEKSSQPADAWRNRRWDSFTLNSPNWAFKLPGGEYSGPEPDNFMPKDEIVRRFEAYTQVFNPNVRYASEARQVEATDDQYRYRTTTDTGTIASQNVVIATGLYHQVIIPPYARQIPQSILQIASDEYRNPQGLPPGAVLVVGSAQSGCQLAEELNQAGRKVFLATCTSGRAPRRYRGLDIFIWFTRIGFLDRTVANLNSPKERFFASPHITGAAGGHDINLHKFSRDGLILLGHTRGFEDGKMIFAPDLQENLTKSDAFYTTVIAQIEKYIQANGLVLPPEELAVLDDGYRVPVRQSLDLAAEGISTIIWATGYLADYSLVQLPILDEYRYPATDRGVTRYPGLYFIGLNWMNKFSTGFLLGIKESAQYLAEVITGS
ncbi:MAG: FAD-dependent oxidoreductase [Anaerolineales bacterium]|nr:MAG: FAD-dependent oxidoreductase [Anaerolineales bacterium]